MTDQRDQCQQLPSPLLEPHWDSSAPTHGTCKNLKIGTAHAHVTINILPEDIFLEIFSFCIWAHKGPLLRMTGWRTLVHVCQRWRQIIYASPRYLGLLLYCSKYEGIPVKNLSYWPPFPIAMSCRHPAEVDDAVALLKHSDRVRLVELTIMGSQWGKVAAAMQESLPALTHLGLSGYADIPVFSRRFLGGSAPCLRWLVLDNIPFPTLPTLLLSARDLVSLRLRHIPPTGYISPEAMVASLAVLTKLETLCIRFDSPIRPPEYRRSRPDRPMRIVLPALTDIEFFGGSEYLEDLVAQIDAPRLNVVNTDMDLLNFLQVPQLFLFISRTENLKFRRVEVKFSRSQVKIRLRVDRLRRDRPYWEQPVQPHFCLTAISSPPWPESHTHVARMALVLTHIFAMCSNVEYLYIRASDDYRGWRDEIDSTEMLAFFRLFPTVETLHISGKLAVQVSRALEDVPGELVTEVLPFLRSLILEDPYRQEPDGRFASNSTEQFVSLRKLLGRPVTIHDPYEECIEDVEFEAGSRPARF